MICCLDVHYQNNKAKCAAVLIEDWQSKEPYKIYFDYTKCPSDYEAGAFYKRELPCLLYIIDKIETNYTTLLIDGYVWLEDGYSKGLGAHLFEALDQKYPIIGVAKNKLYNDKCSTEIYRGNSKHPLFITSVGIKNTDAPRLIQQMYGNFRIPDMLKKADQISRTGLSEQ